MIEYHKQNNPACPLSPALESACRRAERLPRNTLLGYAIARGCFHYAPFVTPELRTEVGDITHEVLGCALLVGPEDVDTFQSIRCGAMVISDLGNSPTIIVAVAKFLGVEKRVRHIAGLGLSADIHPEFWQTIIDLLPAVSEIKTDDFLPGLSRFALETGKRGPDLGPARHWLRTQYNKKSNE